MTEPKRFLVKFLAFTLPFWCLCLFYIITDPFKVIYHYDQYFPTTHAPHVGLNKDYVSMETFTNYYQRYRYDSYIFGNSRSMFYRAANWGQHIGPFNYFHFDASAESIYGIAKKIAYLQNGNYPIKNAIIVLDSSTLASTENGTSHLTIKHPALSGQNWVWFELQFFKAFVDRQFLLAFIDFKISGQAKPYMQASNLIVDDSMDYSLRYNELAVNYFENVIANDKHRFYDSRTRLFYKRDSIERVSAPVIGKEQREYLESIKKAFDHDSTHYRIVINPLYDQLKFNPQDYAYLDSLFGHNQVFDFSGKNDFTNSMYNYYETSHYRSSVADSIMQIIYR